MVTTMTEMRMVASRRMGKRPESVADWMAEPRPMVWRVWPLRWEYSAMTEAFHAPPEAVTMPVMRKGKMPGRMRVVQRCQRVKR